MSSLPHSIPEHERSPFPEGAGRQVAAAIVMLGLAGLVLHLFGRPLGCPCGHVSLWQTAGQPTENSQQFADWYSLLHVAFGMGLFAAVRRARPHWTFGSTLLAVVFGHSLWEIAENTPLIIGMFSGGANAPFYEGDSLFNSFGDTVFALVGASAMSRLTWPLALAIVLAIEVLVSIGADDGFVIGSLRLVGIPV